MSRLTRETIKNEGNVPIVLAQSTEQWNAYLTIFGCLNASKDFSSAISLNVDIGTPSSVSATRTLEKHDVFDEFSFWFWRWKSFGIIFFSIWSTIQDVMETKESGDWIPQRTRMHFPLLVNHSIECTYTLPNAESSMPFSPPISW